ncbi:enoyl-CoA hydratase-related protein [Seohaeicola zhoushanensis]|uniref:SnoaL-like domain-containing protein n=1 Tax=Seohaeicola zhoushanensis TaxID=1569283 RepID=A0A8J3H1S4_9RHOB|nr:enoyl-CoA hydratase-related protein [Seohaeicola zhoushanensis]GHF66296.1 hypothetical protein GCM10017056_41830 [Seohaeicola zhoushanensis]
MPQNADIARALYAALAAGDREALAALLHPAFQGHAAEGMPFGIGGPHDGPEAMRRNVWGRIARNFEARVEPEHFIQLENGRLLVTGRYRGQGQGGAELDAAFIHVIGFADGQIASLDQHTDTHRWHQAAAPAPTVTLDIAEGIAVLRLNRPAKGNAINEQVTVDLLDAANRLAEAPGLRAVLITGNGPHFTLGGDLDFFAGTSAEELPNRLRRMIDRYHLAMERLMALDAPIVAAIRGGAGGGGLGLLYVADITIASDTAQFVLGYGRLGLTSDGGSTWFLPRLVGMQRARELFLLNTRFGADEALAFGLVTRVCPDAALEAEAAAMVSRLAAGPTRAFGGIRRLLRQSFETGLPDQLRAEVDTIVEVSRTADAREGIAAFAAKRSPGFRGT